MVAAQRIGRAERSEQVRSALMAAARDEFLAHGYHGASLDQIAAVAGFTKGVVYSRFASKGDLFLALLEERIEARAQQNERLLADVGDDGLPALVRRWNQVQRADLPWTLLVLEFRIHAARDPELNARYAVLHDRTLAGVADVVERAGIAAGDEARTFVQTMLGMGNGVALEQAVDPSALDDDRAVALMSRLHGGAR